MRGSDANTPSGDEPSAAAPRTWRSTFLPFRHRNFRYYWFGQLLSLFGTWMQSVAQAWLVLQKSDSPWMVGVVTALQFTPVTLFGLFGGVLADRVNKRRLLLLTQSIAATQALLLGLLTVSGTIRVEQIMVLAALLGLVQAFDMPLRQSFVQEMVGRADLMAAIAWNSAAFNTARIVGPAVGGLLIAGIGAGPVFLLNAASFAAVLAALLRIRERELHGPVVGTGAGRRTAGLWRSLGEGLREVRRNRLIRTAVVLVAGVATFGMNFQVILSAMARDVFRIGPPGFGLLMASAGVGSVLAGLHLAWRGSVRVRRTFLLAGTGVGVAGILFALSPRWNSLPLSFALLLVLGFSAITLTATANTAVQQRAPEALRGRVLSIYLTAFASSVPAGGLIAGSLARWRGAPVAALVGGVCTLLVVVWAAAHLRREDDAPAGGSGDESRGPESGGVAARRPVASSAGAGRAGRRGPSGPAAAGRPSEEEAP